ncbi:hypothetical protein [Curtobacterium sp. MCBA15_013]|uniref:hypothetical protein n=1 Tax=Curtobacterium sp. MCBA15_013 TaxID=1898739 RepID=UPI000B0E3021|nr:hypothetical protein [Curtobacterium sp. MCBA15_013]
MTTTLDRTATTAAGGRAASRAAWSSLSTAGRARLLAECSGIAVAGTGPSGHAVGPQEARSQAAHELGGDVRSRCDRVLHDVAAHAAALPAGSVRSTRVRTELVVDAGFPLELATLHLAAALIADETVLLGLCGHVTAGTLRYVRAVAALLPGGVLRISRGDRLVSGGTDRVVWLSSDCVTDRSPVTRGLAVVAAMTTSRQIVDGTSDPARRAAAPTS